MKKKFFSALIITFFGINFMFSQYNIPSCSFNSTADVNSWSISPTTVSKTWFNGGCVAMFVNNLANSTTAITTSPIFNIASMGTYELEVRYGVIYTGTPAIFELVNDATNIVMATSTVTTTAGTCTSWPNPKISKLDYTSLAPGSYRLRVTIPLTSQFFLESVKSNINYSLLSTAEFNDNSNYTIYPNPAKDKIFIKNIQSIAEVKIYDISGKVVNSLKTNSNTVDISNLNKGIYFMEISTENNSFKTKFIKE